MENILMCLTKFDLIYFFKELYEDQFGEVV